MSGFPASTHELLFVFFPFFWESVLKIKKWPTGGIWCLILHTGMVSFLLSRMDEPRYHSLVLFISNILIADVDLNFWRNEFRRTVKLVDENCILWCQTRFTSNVCSRSETETANDFSRKCVMGVRTTITTMWLTTAGT